MYLLISVFLIKRTRTTCGVQKKEGKNQCNAISGHLSNISKTPFFLAELQPIKQVLSLCASLLWRGAACVPPDLQTVASSSRDKLEPRPPVPFWFSPSTCRTVRRRNAFTDTTLQLHTTVCPTSARLTRPDQPYLAWPPPPRGPGAWGWEESTIVTVDETMVPGAGCLRWRGGNATASRGSLLCASTCVGGWLCSNQEKREVYYSL